MEAVALELGPYPHLTGMASVCRRPPGGSHLPAALGWRSFSWETWRLKSNLYLRCFHSSREHREGQGCWRAGVGALRVAPSKPQTEGDSAARGKSLGLPPAPGGVGTSAGGPSLLPGCPLSCQALCLTDIPASGPQRPGRYIVMSPCHRQGNEAWRHTCRAGL